MMNAVVLKSNIGRVYPLTGFKLSARPRYQQSVMNRPMAVASESEFVRDDNQSMNKHQHVSNISPVRAKKLKKITDQQAFKKTTLFVEKMLEQNPNERAITAEQISNLLRLSVELYKRVESQPNDFTQFLVNVFQLALDNIDFQYDLNLDQRESLLKLCTYVFKTQITFALSNIQEYSNSQIYQLAHQLSVVGKVHYVLYQQLEKPRSTRYQLGQSTNSLDAINLNLGMLFDELLDTKQFKIIKTVLLSFKPTNLNDKIGYDFFQNVLTSFNSGCHLLYSSKPLDFIALTEYFDSGKPQNRITLVQGQDDNTSWMFKIENKYFLHTSLKMDYKGNAKFLPVDPEDIDLTNSD